MQAEQAYGELVQWCKEAATLSSCAALLGWDERTYLPTAGATHRGDQLALLAKLVHERATSPRIAEWLSQIEGTSFVQPSDSIPAANVREIRRGYDRAVKIPARLVQELARVCTHAQQAWQQARAKSDFASFQKWLEQIVQLKREEANAVGFGNGVPYDALLDEYEPGARTSEIAAVFAGLRKELVPLIQQIQASPRVPNVSILEREYPTDRQQIFGQAAAAAIGFRFDAGRLDTTTHPFCSGIGPGDCRITTRYNVHHFNESFFGILHEAGHGLYEQGLDSEHYGLATGTAASLGIHESQSRLWENQVGRGRPFWEHFFPRAQQTFPGVLGDVTLDDFVFAINKVEPSFIRVEADEASYNLHIILRFELEQALLTGDLQVKDVPGVWNERFKQSFNLTPPNDALGCLQDIHWSGGGIGYFPTYTLGNMYAAQFMEQARCDIPGVEDEFRRGQFGSLKAWLNEKIHRPGHRWAAAELCKRVTGHPLDPQMLVSYLRNKYAPLYGI